MRKITGSAIVFVVYKYWFTVVRIFTDMSWWVVRKECMNKEVSTSRLDRFSPVSKPQPDLGGS